MNDSTNLELLLELILQTKEPELTWEEFMWETTALNNRCMRRLNDERVFSRLSNCPKDLEQYLRYLSYDFTGTGLSYDRIMGI